MIKTYNTNYIMRTKEKHNMKSFYQREIINIYILL